MKPQLNFVPTFPLVIVKWPHLFCVLAINFNWKRFLNLLGIVFQILSCRNHNLDRNFLLISFDLTWFEYKIIIIWLCVTYFRLWVIQLGYPSKNITSKPKLIEPILTFWDAETNPHFGSKYLLQVNMKIFNLLIWFFPLLSSL